jgi:recombination protein RecA
MAPAAALAARETLESLLRTRHLDTTLTSAQPWMEPVTAERMAPSGWLPLDAALGGGVPRGQVSEIVGPASSGRTSTMHRLLAAATGRGELVALVDVLDRFDPASAREAGVALDQVLWIRGRDGQVGQLALSPDWEPARARPGRQSPMGLAVGRAIKALGLVLSSGGFGLVVLDAADVPVRTLRQLPFTTWLRVQRMIEASDTACVLVADHPLARSAGGASIRLAIGQQRTPSPAVAESRPSFHDLVRASRRPFLGPPGLSVTGRPGPVSSRQGVGPLWTDPSAHPRRLRGLMLHASVRCGLRSTSCEGVIHVSQMT